ncbi:MAG: transcription termination factor NusA [bacterium]
MSDITSAMKQICEEKNLSYEAVVETIESALAAAYRKDFGEKNQNIKVEFDPETGKSKVYDVKTVVEDMPEEIEGDEEEKTEISKAEDESGPEEEVRRFNPKTELQIKDAVLIKKSAKIGDVIKTKLEATTEYGRMAAQTAKQVIIQKLREAEREMIFSEFKDKEHEVVAGVVQRREGRIVLIDLDKAVGILPFEEQVMGEKYKPGDRLKVYVKQVEITPKGPEIILSRTSDEILKKVFYLEIPEISNGLVEIKAVAREAGSRSKVAVSASGENVDPIGSCVGQRGSRIQTIIGELGGEKIDIIEYDEDLVKFIGHALAPAKILTVKIDGNEKKAVVKVAEDQLSLAIGREGQNVRLAARLTGYKLDIVGEKAEAEKIEEENKPEVE